MPARANPIAIVCGYCGGKDVVRDAWAEWDEAAQEWVLRTVFDHAECEDCGGETGLQERPLFGEAG